MLKIVAVVLVFVFMTANVFAQETLLGVADPVSTTVPIVPEPFEKILKGYENEKFDDVSKPNVGSVYNQASGVESFAGSRLIVDAARNWIFTRKEEKFRALAKAFKPRLQKEFGMIFLGRGLTVVISHPFYDEEAGAYQKWYDCVASSNDNEDEDKSVDKPIGSENVLYKIYYWPEFRSGRDGSCKDSFHNLSKLYGVSELSVDDLHVLGFLARRETAHQNNSKFLSAEVIRQVVQEIFDEE